MAADVISYNTTISACEKGSQWEIALQVLANMQPAKTLPDVISFCAAVSACEKASQWESAVHLWSQMPTASIDNDVIAFNATMSACEKASQWQTAFHLFSSWPLLRVLPNFVSLGAVLCALGRGVQWRAALSLFWRPPGGSVHHGVSNMILGDDMSTLRLGSYTLTTIVHMKDMSHKPFWVMYPDYYSSYQGYGP